MKDFNLVAQSTRRTLDIDSVMDGLAGYSPAISTHPRGWAEIIITVPAANLRQAITTGLAIIEQAGVPVMAVEALPTDEFDIRHGDVPLPDLMSVAEAADTLQVSRQRVLQMIDEGKLPRHPVGRSLVLPRPAVTALSEASR